MRSMNKYLILILVVLCGILASVSVTQAITNGQPDGNGHPYVGLVLIYVGDEPQFTCSGSLISPTVVLTAGHCTSAGTSATVWFNSDPLSVGFPDNGGITSTALYTHPGFTLGGGPGLEFDTHDLGIVVLSEPVIDKGFASLPPYAGFVDSLRMKTDVTLVGYGGQIKTRGIPPHYWMNNYMRYTAPTLLIQNEDLISDEYIKLTANPARGKGGICFGDSGGPDLLGGTNMILAVNSWLWNYECAGITYSNRVDTEYGLEWINSFLP